MTRKLPLPFPAAMLALLLSADPAFAGKVTARKSGDVHRGAPVWQLEGFIGRKDAKAIEKCRSERSAAAKPATKPEEWRPCSSAAPEAFQERAREACGGDDYTVRIEELSLRGSNVRTTVIGPYGSQTASSRPEPYLTWYLVCDAQVRVEPADKCDDLAGDARKKCLDEEVDTYTHDRCGTHFRGKKAFQEHVAAGCRPTACHERAREGDVARTSGSLVCVCRNRGDGVLEWFFPDGTRCDWDR